MRKSFFAAAVATAAALAAHAQVPASEADLATQTALLKAQQAYYDQVLATAKSQQAAADAAAAAQLASITTANSLQAAQYAQELALAAAVKGSGLPAATGKEGTVTIAAADKTLLAFQAGSLKLLEPLADSVCKDLGSVSTTAQKFFVAPANYEQLVQKSMADLVQFRALYLASEAGLTAYQGDKASLQIGVAGIAGAMAIAQTLAGGVQALSKLFRTDYTVNFTTTPRQVLFEQMLAARCPARFEGNVEGRLRLNAAKILQQWVPRMAEFVEVHDALSETTTQKKALLAASKALLEARKPADAKEKAEVKKELDLINAELKTLKPREERLAKFKNVATSVKAYLAGLNASTVYEAMVWGQQYLITAGGVPTDLAAINPAAMGRLNYALSMQDASIKASSSFSSEKWKNFSTGELTYAIVDSDATTRVVRVLSKTSTGEPVAMKDLTFVDVNAVYGAAQPQQAAAQ